MSPISFTYSFLHPLAITAPHDPVKLQHNPFTWLFFAMYITHYAHRSIIYPLTAPHMSPSSILAASMAFVYNICNGGFGEDMVQFDTGIYRFESTGYINGRSLSVFSDFSDADLRRPTFWIGLTLFFFGLYTNIKADHMVFALRRNRDAKAEASTDPKLRYSIPRGFLFDFISCPNYFGEIVEWIGFALATKSPAAWNFAIFTFANLFPRALSTHKWYKETFGDSYPKDRKAAIPFVL